MKPHGAEVIPVLSTSETPGTRLRPVTPNDPLTTRPLGVIDLFSGAGGMSEGFAQAIGPQGSRAFQILYGVDNNPDCMTTYRQNLLADFSAEERASRGPCRSVVGLDGTDIQLAAGSAIDIVIGGPNCQAVSPAGLRNTEDPRNSMFSEFLRLVGELRPRWFVMENVPGLTHSNGLPILRRVFEELSELPGYKVVGDVLLAADYGVSQYRYRLFIVGTRSGLPFHFPVPTHFADGAPRHNTVGTALAGLPKPTNGVELDTLNLQRIKHVPQGGDWRDIPVRLLPDRSFYVRSSDQKGLYGRLSWDHPAFTITGLAGNVTAGAFTHPEEQRSITPAEAAALQGFPRDFVFAGSRGSTYQQIGNAVPPALAKAVAEAILASEAGCIPDSAPAPRLTLAVIRDATDGRARLPVMTPRIARRQGRARPERRSTAPRVLPASPNASTPPSPGRQDDPKPRLEAEAKLPGNMWTGKRARAILGWLAARPEAELALEERVSVVSIHKWIADYESGGLEGWRAYHTPLDRSGIDEVLRSEIDEAIAHVRAGAVVMTQGGTPSRPHMGPALRALIRRQGNLSVNEIIQRVEAAGFSLGTVYVDDLLVIADRTLENEPEAPGAIEVSAAPG